METQRSGSGAVKLMAIAFAVILCLSLGAPMLMGAPANVNRFYGGGLSLAADGEGFSIGSDVQFYRLAANSWGLGTGDTLTLPTLTSGRVPVIGAGGLIGDDSDLTFSGDTLTATKIASGSITIASSSLTGATWVNSTNVSAVNLYANTTLIDGYYPGNPCSYTVGINGATFWARNETTGYITTSANVATLMQGRLNSMINGGKIVVKDGIFPIDTTIQIKYDSTTIEGMGESTIFYLTANTTMFSATNTPTPLKNINFRNIRLEGDYHNRANGIGISADLINSFVIENCQINDFSSAAISVTGGTVGLYKIINNNMIDNYKVIDGTSLHDGIIVGNKIGGTAAHSDTNAISLTTGVHQINDNHFYTGKNAIYLRAPQNVDVSHNYFEAGMAINVWNGGGETSFNLDIGDNQFYDAGGLGYVIAMDGAAPGYSGVNIHDNEMSGTVTNGLTIAGVYSGTNICADNILVGTIVIPSTMWKISGNVGFVTENSGTATIASGGTSIVVNHGCSYTPSALDLSVIATNATSGALTIYVDTFTATQFTIHSTGAAGANAPFSWHIAKTP